MEGSETNQIPNMNATRTIAPEVLRGLTCRTASGGCGESLMIVPHKGKRGGVAYEAKHTRDLTQQDWQNIRDYSVRLESGEIKSPHPGTLRNLRLRAEKMHTTTLGKIERQDQTQPREAVAAATGKA